MIANALKIDGWMSPTELQWLANVAKRSRIVIESGCYKGRSTRALADNCTGYVYAVDPWPEWYPRDDGKPLFKIGDEVFREFIKNVMGLSNTATVCIFKGTLQDFGSTKADFIFLDGDHRYEMVKKDIESAKALLNPGGILAGHDYKHKDWPGVKQAVDELIGEPVNLIDSIWWKIYE